MRTVFLPSNLHLVAFLFKDEGGLGKHLFIFPHQELFGYQEKQERGGKGEKITRSGRRRNLVPILLSD